MGEKINRFEISHLDDPVRLPLEAASIDKLSGEWGHGSWRAAWSDIEFLADRFLRVEREGSAERDLAWHHLLMAVGNFKRSAGTIFPFGAQRRLGDLERLDTSREFAIPALDTTVTCDDERTWPALTKIAGLAVPTATTLLSALWPMDHAIIDRRDIGAAISLAAGDRLRANGLDDARRPDIGWPLYRWFRKTVTLTASGTGRTPVAVERSLYVLDQSVRRKLSKGWAWSDYNAMALACISDE